MKSISRTKSLITGKENLESLYKQSNYPVFFGCVEHSRDRDQVFDLSWAICPESGIIQLDKLLPLEVVYQEQHVDSTGPTWKKYNFDFAAFIVARGSSQSLEIGGGAGLLAEAVIAQRPDWRWCIVEPNPIHAGTEKIKITRGFFDRKFKPEVEIQSIVLSQVLEHIYEPEAFLFDIFEMLPVGGSFIFAYPQLEQWLKKKYTNTLNFEHTVFLTDYFVDFLLKKTGFQIVTKEPYLEHSFFYHCIKSQQFPQNPQFDNKYAEYKQLFLDYVTYHSSLVARLNKKILEHSGQVYMFGAHIFSQALLQFGLNESRISGLLDNSPLKHGKRLYGSGLTVEPPQAIAGKTDTAVILKVGIYKEEVTRQLREINPNILIWDDSD